MTHSHGNLLGEPPATLLPASPEAERELAEGTPAAEVAAHHPTVSAAWASTVTQRRKPRLGSCDHGTGPKPFQPLRRSASSPRW